MFMLQKSKLGDGLWTMGLMDAATNGSLESLYRNVLESASILDEWETAYPKAKAVLLGYEMKLDDGMAEAEVKHLWQCLRHGLCFDWVINYVVGRLLEAYPFAGATYFKFKRTEEFINSMCQGDPIFEAEILELKDETDKLIAWVFEGARDPTVFKRLATDSGLQDFGEVLNWLRETGRVQDYHVSPETMYRVNYIVLLCEMLSEALGLVNRKYWTDLMLDIKEGKFGSDYVIVVGNKFEAFVYSLWPDTGVASWKALRSGIQMHMYSQRTNRDDYVRVLPDTMTFFRLAEDRLLIDETMFPRVQIGDDPQWYGPIDFQQAPFTLDTPMWMTIKYPFKMQKGEKRVIKLKGRVNCVIKDARLELDENCEAKTQIVFRGTSASFMISETKKEYPFGVFSSKKGSTGQDFAWL